MGCWKKESESEDMSVEKWFISDMHFGHRNIVKFESNDGRPVRPWNDVDEMDEALVDNWNAVVRPNDIVFVLGDVVINKKMLPIVDRLFGRKRLIMGNHDMAHTSEFMKYFEKIYGALELKMGEGDYILSHIPLALQQKERFFANIHGHMHSYQMEDPWYVSVCVEQTNYAPMHMDHVRQIAKYNIRKDRELRKNASWKKE